MEQSANLTQCIANHKAPIKLHAKLVDVRNTKSETTGQKLAKLEKSNSTLALRVLGLYNLSNFKFSLHSSTGTKEKTIQHATPCYTSATEATAGIFQRLSSH